jgi:oligo-1,6-glucosidase
VVNHTSDEHAWFQKALTDPAAPEKDYYLWEKGRDGGPPNNWQSLFSGPAWNYYPGLDEWALHLFSKKQMDLNWDNADLRREVYTMINWWLEKGVDGFRMDVISFISKATLEDGNAILSHFAVPGIEHYFYGPHLHEYLHEMHQVCFERHDAFSVGECPIVGMEASKMLTAEERGELDMVFNFAHLDNPGKSRMIPYTYDLRFLKSYFLEWQMKYGNNCWPALFFENHDNPRMISKVTPDVNLQPFVAKLLAVLQFTLKGTPFVYQGQELGMTNSCFESVDEIRDVEAINRYQELLKTHSSDEAFTLVSWGTRDHARTPMQWTGEDNAGFSRGNPWIPVNPNYRRVNFETEKLDPNSVFHFFSRLIKLRRENPLLIYGDFKPIAVQDADTFCYYRMSGMDQHDENQNYIDQWYIEINLSAEKQRRPELILEGYNLLIGNYNGREDHLRPYEANVYHLESEKFLKKVQKKAVY